jgi:hypothetical protein
MKVFKGGATSRSLTAVTDDVDVTVTGSTIDCRFTVASAGGGNSIIVLRLERGELPALLNQVAHAMRGANRMFASAAASAAAVADERLRRSFEDLEVLVDVDEVVSTYALRDSGRDDPDYWEVSARSSELTTRLWSLRDRLELMHAPEESSKPPQLRLVDE